MQQEAVTILILYGEKFNNGKQKLEDLQGDVFSWRFEH